MDDFINIALKILVALLSAGATWLIIKAQTLWPEVKAWIVSKTNLVTEEQLDTFVSDTVKAADQLLKADDPTGEKRNSYVIETLKSAGIEISELVLAKIEAKVLDLGHSDTEKTAPTEDEAGVSDSELSAT